MSDPQRPEPSPPKLRPTPPSTPQAPTPDAPTIGIPAATVAIFRRDPAGAAPQLLMVERAPTMRFAAGASVFPGGRVDAADQALAARIAPQLAADDAAGRIAALRETLEETGLLLGIQQPVTAAAARDARALLLESGDLASVLDRHGWTVTLDAFIPFARWCPRWEGAFDTRFYLADLGTGAVDVAVDETENSRLYWSSATDTLTLADTGAISAIYPTRCNLERLAPHADFAAACADAAKYPPALIQPWQEWREGVEHLVIPENAGYPITARPVASTTRGRR